MTKKEMHLPLSCEKHTHVGYGTSKEVPCPWCEIERLRLELDFLREDRDTWRRSCGDHVATIERLRGSAEPSDDRADAREDLAYYEGAKAALVIAEKESPATAHAWVEGGCGGRLSQARAALKSKAPLCDCDAECVGPDARADKLCRAEEGALRTSGD